MNSIICKDKQFLHFYNNSKDGLLLTQKSGSRWSVPEVLCPSAKTFFDVFLDNGSHIHILCTNENRDIIYITSKENSWSEFVLSHGSGDIEPMEFKIAEYGGFLNFFYSAKYMNSVILVHCLLSPNAQPRTIDNLSSEYPSFCVSSGKVYYTSSNNILGFKSFADGKPDTFNKVTDMAFMPFATAFGNNEYLLYKKDNSIYLNNKEIITDSACQNPIIIVNDEKLTIQWQSASYIRYVTSFNKGLTWSSPMRFISSGHEAVRFFVDAEGFSKCHYGHHSPGGPVIYGKTNAFLNKPLKKISFDTDTETEKYDAFSEIKKIKILLNLQQKEIDILKSKVKKSEEK